MRTLAIDQSESKTLQTSYVILYIHFTEMQIVSKAVYNKVPVMAEHRSYLREGINKFHKEYSAQREIFLLIIFQQLDWLASMKFSFLILYTCSCSPYGGGGGILFKNCLVLPFLQSFSVVPSADTCCYLKKKKKNHKSQIYSNSIHGKICFTLPV